MIRTNCLHAESGGIAGNRGIVGSFLQAILLSDRRFSFFPASFTVRIIDYVCIEIISYSLFRTRLCMYIHMRWIRPFGASIRHMYELVIFPGVSLIPHSLALEKLHLQKRAGEKRRSLCNPSKKLPWKVSPDSQWHSLPSLRTIHGQSLNGWKERRGKPSYLEDVHFFYERPFLCPGTWADIMTHPFFILYVCRLRVSDEMFQSWKISSRRISRPAELCKMDPSQGWRRIDG